MDAARQPLREAKDIVAKLIRTHDGSAQAILKDELRNHPAKFEQALLGVLRYSPFFELDRPEIEDLEARRRYRELERDLMVARQLAAKLAGRRIALFAMPKSGSTFVSSAICHAGGNPFCVLTTVPADGGEISSRLGANGREQELDELAIILQTLRCRGSWVAQHHTRCHPYLASQLRFFGIRPIVLVRNAFDAIVSLDDMLMAGRGGWELDPPFGVPLDYAEMPRPDRLTLLAQDFGIWLVKFMLSWKRAIAAGLTDPLVLSYERDVLDPASLAGRIGDYLGFNDAEREALVGYVAARPGAEARFNKGVTGRGAEVPDEARTMLISYARRFRSELGDDGLDDLFGDHA